MRIDRGKIRAAIATGILAVLAGCGWAPVFISRSPSGKAELRVSKNPPTSGGSYRLRVELRGTGEPERLLYSEDTDSMLGLVEVHWTSREEAVGLLACNMITGPILVAYDLEKHASLPPNTFKSVLESQLRAQYAVPAQASAIDWACSTEGQLAYSRKNLGTATAR